MTKLKFSMYGMFSVVLLAVLMLGTIPAQAQTLPPNDGPTPEGLNTEDWEQIEALLPESAPYRQQAYIKASNTAKDDYFGAGASIAISGDTLVVGAPEEDSNATGVNGDQTNNLAADSGAVYVFVRTGSTWSQQAYLKASNANALDGFGATVAISGDTIVVGATSEDSSAKGVNGDQADNSAVESGAAYVFVRTGSTWSQQAYLKASNTGAYDEFGRSVTISGDTIAIGAPAEDSDSTGINGPRQGSNSFKNAGAVYIFTRIGTTWTQNAYVKAADPHNSTDPHGFKLSDAFGAAVAISNDTLVVGASGAYVTMATGHNLRCGAAYVFVRVAGVWSQQAKLQQTKLLGDCGQGIYSWNDPESFGGMVGISGNTIVVGACGEDGRSAGINSNQNDDEAIDAGAAYVFLRNGNAWSEQAYLKSSKPAGIARFCSVSISADTVAVGEMMYSQDSSTWYTGNVHIFGRAGTVWSQVAYLKPLAPDRYDYFGSYTALDGNTLIVTVPGDASNATGINGDEHNNSASNAGAVYAFDVPPYVVNSRPADANPTTAASVDFTVTFSEPMTGVDVGDFVLTSAGVTGASITALNGGPQTYIVSVNTGSDDGTLRLDVLDDDSILNANNVPLGDTGLGNGDFKMGGVYSVRPITQTFTSQGAQDGWILESRPNSRVGGTMDASTGLLNLGDNAKSRQYRSILHFDTAGLPDTAVVTGAKLQIKKQSMTGNDMFTRFGSLRVDLSKPNFGDSQALEIIDFQAGPSATYAVGYFLTPPVGNWYSATLTNNGMVNINLSGSTQFRLNFAIRTNGDSVADLFKIYSGNAAAPANRPTLVVEYYVP